MSARLFARRLILPLLLLQLAVPGSARAQSDELPGAQIILQVGDVLEFFAVTGNADTEEDWVLTKDGSFMEASRDRIFRTRLTEQGDYVLDGHFSDGETDRRLRVDIVALPRDENAGDPENADDAGLSIVTVNLPEEQDGVHIAPESPVLTLTPSPAFTGTISADLDTGSDSDADGDPGNDNDVGDTIFASEHSPLHLWYPAPENIGGIRLSVTADDGTPLTQELGVIGDAGQAAEGDIGVSSENQGSVRFSFAPDGGVNTSSVVYLWDFGDGQLSMAEDPQHRFAANDEYTVRVTVREMATGRIVAEGERLVTIVGLPEVPAGTSSSSGSPVVSAPGQASGSGSLVGTILRILLVLLAAIAVGAFVVWGFTKFMRREGGLQKALEEAEGKLLKTDAKGAVDIAPVTMKLTRPAETVPAPVQEDTLEQSIQSEKDNEPTAAKPVPASSVKAEAPAPAWLQKGLAAAKTDEASASLISPLAPEPTPAPIPETPAAPEQLSSDQTPTLSEDDLLPPWLKEDQSAVTPEPEPAPVVPAPQPEPAPVSAPEPMVAPEPEPAPPLLPTREPAVVAELPTTDTPPAPAVSVPEPAPVIEPEPTPVSVPEPIVALEPEATPVPAPQPEPAPVIETPTPAAEALPLPDPITPVIPAPVADPTPAPTPVPDQTAPVTPAPVPQAEWKPAPAPAAPVPSVTVNVNLPPVLATRPSTPLRASSTPFEKPQGKQPVTGADAERAERERERKRRKRQRYRENLKSRKQAEPAKSVAQTSPTVPTPVTPKSPAQTPEKSQAPPNLNPTPQTLNPSSPPAQPSDDTVAFVIKAEGIEKKPDEKKRASGQKDT